MLMVLIQYDQLFKTAWEMTKKLGRRYTVIIFGEQVYSQDKLHHCHRPF